MAKKKIMREYDLVLAEIRAQELSEGHYGMGEAVALIHKLIISNQELLKKRKKK